MRQKSLIDVCVISENPYFINRIKIFSQYSEITFNYSKAVCSKSTVSLFLVDIEQLEVFLKEKKFTTKFIVFGEQKDLAPSFNAGCIDFLKNPWNNDELEARILKTIYTASTITQWEKLTLSQKTITLGNFSTDISIEEYIILKKLLDNKQEPVPREALLFALWGEPKEDSRVVDMHISNIRKKIKTIKQYDNKCCGSIKTIRNYGYMII